MCGLIDSNDKITNNYWFLKYLRDFKNIPQVLEVKNLDNHEIDQQLKILDLIP